MALEPKTKNQQPVRDASGRVVGYIRRTTYDYSSMRMTVSGRHIVGNGNGDEGRCRCGTAEGAFAEGVEPDEVGDRCCTACNRVDVERRVVRGGFAEPHVACLTCKPLTGYERLERRRGKRYEVGETPDADVAALLDAVERYEAAGVASEAIVESVRITKTRERGTEARLALLVPMPSATLIQELREARALVVATKATKPQFIERASSMPIEYRSWRDIAERAAAMLKAGKSASVEYVSSVMRGEPELARAIFVAANREEIERRAEYPARGGDGRTATRVRETVETMWADPAYARAREQAEEAAARIWKAREVWR